MQYYYNLISTEEAEFQTHLDCSFNIKVQFPIGLK